MKKTTPPKLDKITNIGQIDLLSSKDQYYKGTTNLMGIDTEMLLEKDGKVLWPHELEMPQERGTPEGTKFKGGSFDFHGDGFAAELCIIPNHCLDNLMSYLAPAFAFLGSKLSIDTILTPPVYSLPEEVVEAAPSVVKRLGCMPSSNVYDDKGDPTVLGDLIRTTGCHLHISHPQIASEEFARNIIKWADVMVGTAWTFISQSKGSLEVFRRKAYGRAGEYRYRTYPAPDYYNPNKVTKGVEYRVLPGGVMANPVYFTLMLSLYRTALRAALETSHAPPEAISAAAQQAINEFDKTLAFTVLETLPLHEQSQKLLVSLEANPPKTLTVKEWAINAEGFLGHVAYAVASGLTEDKRVHTFHYIRANDIPVINGPNRAVQSRICG